MIDMQTYSFVSQNKYTNGTKDSEPDSDLYIQHNIAEYQYITPGTYDMVRCIILATTCGPFY